MNPEMIISGVLNSGSPGPISCRVYLQPPPKKANQEFRLTRKLHADESDQGWSWKVVLAGQS